MCVILCHRDPTKNMVIESMCFGRYREHRDVVFKGLTIRNYEKKKKNHYFRKKYVLNEENMVIGHLYLFVSVTFVSCVTMIHIIKEPELDEIVIQK